MRSPARGDIDVALPGAQNFNGQMRRGAEAEQSNALSGLDPGHAETAEADDSGAQQRRGMKIVERRWKRKNEIGAGQRIFRIAAVDAVSGERRRVAKVLHVAAAIPATPVGASNPGDANAGAHGKLGSGACDNVADDLVAGDQLRAALQKFALDDVQVGAADATSADL